ncbi:Nucleoid occlusion protein [compost metagenome]
MSLDTDELQEKVLGDVISKELNVKQTEARVAFYKEASKAKKSRRISFTKDVRLALNTIRQSIDMVTSSGLKIETKENDRDDHYEIVIHIPKR